MASKMRTGIAAGLGLVVALAGSGCVGIVTPRHVGGIGIVTIPDVERMLGKRERIAHKDVILYRDYLEKTDPAAYKMFIQLTWKQKERLAKNYFGIK